MLLALKNDDLFNLVASLDVVLNGLSAAFGTMNSVRRELGQRIKPDAVEGHVFTGTFDNAQFLALRPLMVEVNTLVEKSRADAKRNVEVSSVALDKLQSVFREKLGMAYKIESKARPKNASPVSS
jgi:hypothetical protein